MIKTLIDRLVATYPTQIDTLANVLAQTAPVLLILAALWLLAECVEALIEWNERRCTARAKGLRYRSANDKRMDREIEQLWRRVPDASGALREPWRDTVPPAEPARHSTARAGRVVPFPTPNREQQS